jgi:NADPH-dependent curcumin reductase CurA
MGNMNLNGRIVICGLIAEYNDQPNKGVQNFDEVIMKRLTIGGFVVLDHMTDRGEEAVGAIAGLMAEGKIKPLETLTEGLETAPMALNRLYEGDNVGKLLIKVADPPL